MGLKVIGAGFGRTGTLSLKFALERLGFDKCYHMMEMPLVPEPLSLIHISEPTRLERLGGAVCGV